MRYCETGHLDRSNSHCESQCGTPHPLSIILVMSLVVPMRMTLANIAASVAMLVVVLGVVDGTVSGACPRPWAGVNNATRQR